MKKNALLNKIIFKKSSRFTLFFGIIGFTLGWIILLFSIDFYYKTRAIFAAKENKEYLIISKEVAGLSFGGSKNTFSTAEIDEIKKQNFVKRLAPFVTNLYEVWTTGNFMIPIQTELFFESISDEMLDVQIPEFTWEIGHKQTDIPVIPVLISKDFLNLYNFGYAIARNLPQIPPSLVMIAPPLNAKIYNNKKTKEVQFKIVGFTERVPSILVPISFMKWANDYFEPQLKENAPARLMLEVAHIADPALIAFLENHQYSAKKENLSSSKMIQTAFILTGVIASMGLLFVFLSLMIFLSNTKTMLLESKQEIKLLLEIGYSPKFLQVFIFFRLLLLLVINFVISWILFGYLHKKVTDFLQEKGLDFSNQLDISLYIVSAFLFGLLLWISNYFMRQQMKYK